MGDIVQEIHTNALEGSYNLHTYAAKEDGTKGDLVEERVITYIDATLMLEQDTSIVLVED